MAESNVFAAAHELGEWPEKLTVTQARRMLKISPSKVTQLLRQNLIRH